MSELRKDPVIRRWVIVSQERDKNLSEYFATTEEKKDFCPFCPGNEEKTPKEIIAVKGPEGGNEKSGWIVRIIPDKFPLLRIEGDLTKRGQGMYDLMKGVGAHEVIIEAPEHDADWTKLEIKHLEIIIGIYRQRYLDLRKDPRFKHIVIVKNQGGPVTHYIHPHSHVLAMPFLIKRVDEELNSAIDYFQMKERCIYCDIIDEEIRIGKRIIIESNNFLVFAPFASRFPFEICIVPKVHISDFSAIGDELLRELSGIFKETITKIKKGLKNLSYSMVLHSAPVQRVFKDEYHWHWEIMPRSREMMGFEWGTGLYINSVLPEEAAKILRDAV